MKKFLLFLFASILSANSVVWAQSPDYVTTLKNSALLLNNQDLWDSSWSNFTQYTLYINIPLYLDSPKNTTIKYRWYDTKMVFGDKVRASDSPTREEEGTYVNGLLYMYKESYNTIYKFNWDGKEIMSIIEYDGTGAERKRYSKNYNHRWVYNETVSVRRPNEHTHSVSISNVLLVNLIRRDIHEAKISLTGLYINSGYLRVKHAAQYRSSGKWRDNSWDKIIVRVMPDGRPANNNCYDFNDRARCECAEY